MDVVQTFLTIIENQGLSLALVVYLLWKDHSQGKKTVQVLQDVVTSNLELASAIRNLQDKSNGYEV